jgi:hypothetical protein
MNVHEHQMSGVPEASIYDQIATNLKVSKRNLSLSLRLHLTRFNADSEQKKQEPGRISTEYSYMISSPPRQHLSTRWLRGWLIGGYILTKYNCHSLHQVKDNHLTPKINFEAIDHKKQI